MAAFEAAGRILGAMAGLIGPLEFVDSVIRLVSSAVEHVRAWLKPRPRP